LLLLLRAIEIAEIAKAVVTGLLSGSDNWRIFEVAEVTEAVILIDLWLFERSKVSKIAKPVILRWLLHYWRWHHWFLAQCHIRKSCE
jgi:hypothetical protein